MSHDRLSCVLLADGHSGLAEGMRGMLSTLFETVAMVADPVSLRESARRLAPDLIVVDLSLTRTEGIDWLRQLRQEQPDLAVIALTVHDEPGVRQAVLEAGAEAVLLKREIATGLLPAIERLRARRAQETS